ncbi:hypothetical protein [Algicella marina]|uniref:Uncharacterized protein n=1 Tax=Algicella marina TaxID=2683284 RepID=A0A6P1T0L1_9RHOB|nr:hypothetical protein [Algicella marina]QHQ34829.1 hypothetical protein GO499_06260 [Algicella marina]
MKIPLLTIAVSLLAGVSPAITADTAALHPSGTRLQSPGFVQVTKMSRGGMNLRASAHAGGTGSSGSYTRPNPDSLGESNQVGIPGEV